MTPEFPSRIARVGSVIALIGSLIWVQWPIDFEKYNAAAIIIFIASIMAWASIEFADYSNYSNNTKSDDVDKINFLLILVHYDQFYVLKFKEIQTYMDDDDYKGLRHLVYHQENDIFDFHNKNLQQIYVKFANDAQNFLSEFFDLYHKDGQGRMTWRKSEDDYVSEEIYDRIMLKKYALDRKASKLAGLWEEFIKIARMELKGASKSIERYEP